MPLDQQLLDAGFSRSRVMDLDQTYEYVIRVENDDDAGVVRLSPSDMLNGWWHSQFVPKRSLFHTMMVPISLAWIQRELSQFGVNFNARIFRNLEWWKKEAKGFYKGHPWRPETFSRVYAGNLIQKATVTKGSPNYPGVYLGPEESMRTYLSREPFAIRGSDPRPKPPEKTTEEEKQVDAIVTAAEKALSKPERIVTNEVMIAAFREGRLNIQAEIERRAREIAAAEVDRATANIPWQVVDGEGEVILESTAKGPNPFFKRTSKQQTEESNSVLPSKRKIDL